LYIAPGSTGGCRREERFVFPPSVRRVHLPLPPRITTACGPGEAVATVAAAKALDKTNGFLLTHANGNEIMLGKMGATSAESVGYAAVVF